jgi:hypothetical protein
MGFEAVYEIPCRYLPREAPSFPEDRQGVLSNEWNTVTVGLKWRWGAPGEFGYLACETAGGRNNHA